MEAKSRLLGEGSPTYVGTMLGSKTLVLLHGMGASECVFLSAGGFELIAIRKNEIQGLKLRLIF